jgi:membrane protease YdiL (CAAX protease family)
MNKAKNQTPFYQYLGFLLVPFFYFGVSWFFPWDIWQGQSSISVSYFFDVIFCLFIFLIFKRRNFLGFIRPSSFIIQAVSLIIFAAIFINISFWLKLNVPFKYVDNLIIQLLILAPIIEECVFRGAFIEFSEKLKMNKEMTIVSNSLFFSLSHLPAIWNLPKEFHSFIGLQLFYTLILGAICTSSRLKTKGIIAPILLHFIFNAVFYIAIVKYGL